MRVYNKFKGTFEIDKDFYEIFKECCSTDETRYFMQHVWFDGKEHNFVATNGRELVCHYSEDIAEDGEGFYTPVKIGKIYKLIPVDCDGQFPNYKRVIPELETMKDVIIDDECMFNLSGKLADDSKMLCKIIMALGTCFNIEFLTKIMKHVPSFSMMKNKEFNNKAILCNIDSNTRYIFMPMGE